MALRIFVTPVQSYDENHDAVYANAGSASFELEITGARGLLENSMSSIDYRLGILDQAPIRSAIEFSFGVGAKKFKTFFDKDILPLGFDRMRVIVKTADLSRVLFRGLVTSSETKDANASLYFNCENPLDSTIRKILPIEIAPEAPDGVTIGAISAVRQMLARAGAEAREPLIDEALMDRDYDISISQLQQLSSQIAASNWINRIIRPMSLYIAETEEGEFYLADRITFGEPVGEINADNIKAGSVQLREIVEARTLNAISYDVPFQGESDRAGEQANRVQKTHQVVAVGDAEDKVYSIDDLVDGDEPSTTTKRSFSIYEFLPEFLRFTPREEDS